MRNLISVSKRSPEIFVTLAVIQPLQASPNNLKQLIIACKHLSKDVPVKTFLTENARLSYRVFADWYSSNFNADNFIFHIKFGNSKKCGLKKMILWFNLVLQYVRTEATLGIKIKIAFQKKSQNIVFEGFMHVKNKTNSKFMQ